MQLRALALAHAFACTAAGCGATSKCGPAAAVVASVVDGDTVELEGAQKVRYLLVDTPEITSGKNDCYGTQAADFNRSKVEGRTVSLRYDEAECSDRFNRLLAYVTADGLELNKALVQQGLACVLYVAPGGKSRHDEFLTWESEAKTARAGMWGACAAIPCSK